MSSGIKGKVTGLMIVVFIIVLILTAAASLFLGTANIGYVDVFRILLHHIPGLGGHISIDGIPEKRADGSRTHTENRCVQSEKNCNRCAKAGS